MTETNIDSKGYFEKNVTTLTVTVCDNIAFNGSVETSHVELISDKMSSVFSASVSGEKIK